MWRLIWIFLLIPLTIEAQKGSLLVVGGGSESNDYAESWSTQAYSWAVRQAPNKKVAVIHYKDTGNWLKPYFTDHCGAIESKNFVINASNANDQSLIDDLMQYDMFFFRGGDQYYYYSYYNETLMEQTMKDKFNEGGVLAGTSAGLAILSEVIFWAENGSAYSDVVVKNIDNSRITLADDFMDAAPGLIFDSHFVNRGRMGRLIAFMANYEKHNSTRIKGIGVDETTALAITPENKAIAFGTRAANIYSLPEVQNFGEGPALSFRDMEVKQLVHGDTLDLVSLEVKGLSTQTHPEKLEENTVNTIYLGGSETLSNSNKSLLQELLEDGGGSSDKILLITGSSTNLANSFKSHLEQLGANEIIIGQAISENINDPSLEDAIQTADKIIFLENSTYNFKVFLFSGGNGDILAERLTDPELIMAFIGDNARLAGPFIVNNYLSGGEGISISEGLGILSTTCIIPRAFDPPGGSTDGWYTTHISIPYAMIKENLAYGIWLNNDNYAVYKTEGNKAVLSSHGSSPVMIMKMSEGFTDFTEMTYNGQPGENPNPVAGFDNMKLTFLADGETINMGNLVSTTQIQHHNFQPILFPNPVYENLSIKANESIENIKILDCLGRMLFSSEPHSKVLEIPVSNFEKGFYLIQINTSGNNNYSKVFVKN